MGEPCVIARLFGGLGNQLFIYAFARAMAARNDVPLRLDIISGFMRDPVYRRRFLLDRLVSGIVPASLWESRAFAGGRTLRSLDRKLNKLLPLEKRYFVQERTLAFDPDIYNIKITRPMVFNGVWQSPQYFDNLDMRALLEFPAKLLKPLDDDVQAIRHSNAVCLAIRRYEEVPKPRHHILSVDYFHRAMALMAELVDKPHFFVFAQDLEWASENIQSPHPVTFAQQRDPHEGVIQDLYLMMQCRHYILSNSSLHWWAACLGDGNGKIVLAPEKGWPSSDILPAQWDRVE